MQRVPRPVGAPVLASRDWVRLCVQGFVMTVGTLAVYMLAEPEYGAAVASTMLLTTLSLFHVVAGYMARDPEGTVFDRDALPGATQLRRYGLALAAIVLVTMLGFLQRIFSTVELGFNQWAICVGIALSLLVVEEVIKLFLRRRAAPRA